MRHLRFATVIALALAPTAFAQEIPVDETSATPTIQVENAAKLFDQFVALESAWDPALGQLYMPDAVIDRTTLKEGEPELQSFTGPDYLAAMPAIFEQAKAAGATEAWTNTKVLYDGPGRTLVTSDLTITSGGAVSPTAKVQLIIFDMPDGPMQVTSDVRTVAAPGYTPPADESAAFIEKLGAGLGALDSAAIAALIPDDAKIEYVELSEDGEEISRVTQSKAEFIEGVETEFAAAREAKGTARFAVYESYKNEDSTWYVRGQTVVSAPESHDAYNVWGDMITLAQKDGVWTVASYVRSYQRPAT